MAIRISLGFSGFVAHNLASSANIHVNNCCGIHRCWVRSLLFGTNQISVLDVGFNVVFSDLKAQLEALVTNNARESEIQGVIGEVPDIILRCVSRDEAALAVAQKVFKGLYENATNQIHVGAHLAMLTAIRDVCKLVFTQLNSWVCTITLADIVYAVRPSPLNHVLFFLFLFLQKV
ncbi:uncharacterized protein LOC112203838 [Rosa chinensis]|uniref:uncharacterized protein LOC112203838 n=1 Tax=Rosa chinensis TaxID=74649 RepID=UPI001AD8FC6E|nr:uncharacterized protein LOC112203838 [Rosa chinensis]